MRFDWQSLNPDEMEQHFNPRVAVSNVDALIADYTARAAAARERLPGDYDLCFGDGEHAHLDLHRAPGADGTKPLLVFIHGGYWRALDKRDHSFVALPFMDRGISVANVNYDLLPHVSLDTIVEQITAACRFCGEHAGDWGASPGQIVLVGHSAGAHLAAKMLLHDWAGEGIDPGFIRGLVALTGIYEPEVILGISVNAEARMTEDVAKRHNCLARPPVVQTRALVAVGGDEPVGWQDQSRQYAATCKQAGLATDFRLVEGQSHFSILDRALDARSPLGQAVLDLF